MVKLSCTKLKGEAKRVAKDQKFGTIAKLEKHLELIYSTVKTMQQLLGELGNEYQRDDEGVIPFANRIRDTQYRLNDAQSGEITAEFRAAVQKNLTDCLKRVPK